MYLKMFGFSEKPFHITPNPRFIFLSKKHKEAFAHLLYGVQQRVGFFALSGEIGTGKTTVLRTLLGQLDEADYRVALIFNPCLSAIELLQVIHREFAIDYNSEKSNLVDLFDSLNRFLLVQREEGKTVVLVIDEAQNLDPKVLEQLRLLSNLETETEKLIQLVLVGQPELDEILQRKDLRQLRQRLAVSYKLEAMDAEDTRAYVLHRLKIAGAKSHDLFQESALAQVYRFSKGTPRLVNILCDRALLVAYARDARSVTKADVQTAQKELQHQQKTSRFTSKNLVAIGLAALVLIMLTTKLLLSPPQLASQEAVPDQAVPSVHADEPLPPAPVTVEKSQSVEPVVDQQRVELYKKRIVTMPVEETGLQAMMQFAESWQHDLPKAVPSISNKRQMVTALEKLDLVVLEYDGRIEDLLHYDVPAILEIALPGVARKRYLSLTGQRDGFAKLWPQISEDGWVALPELERIWFGKALLAYRNFDSISMVNRPGKKGRTVAAIQELLIRNGADNVLVSQEYDPPTIAAVADFQQKKRLAPDGRVGAFTLFWLYRDAGYAMPRLTTETAQ
ncbi:general secretion pathway protein A [Malonomonas rubra DSM 5091]|uniref:General secretion pathway protein A n=1 Tax=Malonomonas rubra DSM 5091 TaxID=1122189 RepID=A0A1M6B8Q5_MALRU|nr:ExeA family protein [Malonomonas rubra]SHI45120.1 general secretion pathway protein A [Malonomonas rubra DSM 5091]